MAIVSKMNLDVTPERGEEQRRRKKKRSPRGSLACATFQEQYKVTGESLGQGSYGKVETCVNVFTGQEFAVKIIQKVAGLFNRSKVLKEIELYHHCRGEDTIIQLVEFFEEPDTFYLVFEKMEGGPLLRHIQRRGSVAEAEAALVTRDLATALLHLHDLGVAHRDIKPDNVLCSSPSQPWPVKLCDFDLCSAPSASLTPALLSPVGSLEYMAPEVVDTFVCNEEELDEDDLSLSYTLACDLWSLGVLLYLLLSGSPPFSGSCPVPDCGWDLGGSCSTCQRELLADISQGALVFPSDRWSGVSEEARDLVTGLLTRDPVQRLTCRQVLDHPWTQDRERLTKTGHSQQQDDLWAGSSSFPLLGDERRSMGVVARLEAELAGQGYSMRAMG